jgi:hypothetical protein
MPPGIMIAIELCESAHRRSFNGLKVFVLVVLLSLTESLFGSFFAYTLFLPFDVEFFDFLLEDVVSVGLREVDFIGLGEVDFACVDVGVAIAN